MPTSRIASGVIFSLPGNFVRSRFDRYAQRVHSLGGLVSFFGIDYGLQKDVGSLSGHTFISQRLLSRQVQFKCQWLLFVCGLVIVWTICRRAHQSYNRYVSRQRSRNTRLFCWARTYARRLATLRLTGLPSRAPLRSFIFGAALGSISLLWTASQMMRDGIGRC